MWFKRVTLEVWFDDYQYHIEHDLADSAVKFLTLDELDIDLRKVPLRYGYHRGKPPLRACVAEQYPGLSGDNIVVTTGASEANFAVVAAIVQPGDHVIVEHPNYPSLYEVPRSLGCEVSLLHLTFDNQFELTPETKLISFTHPNNPTGSMISEETLQALVDFIEEHDTYLLFDETYRAMDFSNSLPPAATLSPKVISISSISKCYGLPGIRIGWVATKNQSILDAVLSIREQVSISNNAVGEEIALHVLQRKDAFLRHSQTHIEKNRQIAADWIDRQADFEWIYPKVGVVRFPRIKQHVRVEREEFYRLLAERYNTLVVPGRCFEMDNRYFRLSFGATREELEIGLQNLNRALSDLV
jgi:aspartate/methionine/tyrosine aminotransferase